jgi:hypothetical protein
VKPTSLLSAALCTLFIAPPGLVARARAADPQPAPAPGSAEPEKEGAAPSGEAAASDQPQAVRVTTFLLPHPTVPDQLLVPVMRAIDEGLKRNPRLEMKDLDTRLADFAQEVPSEQIEEARTQLKEGEKALFALELPKAVKTLGAAVESLSKVLPHIKKQELAQAQMSLAAAQWQLGDRKTARQTMVKLLTWRPEFKLDVNKYPPSLLPPFDEAKREVDRQKRGSIEIRTEPLPAQAYVDGKYVGVTPTFAEGLVVGDHYVTLKREGFRKAVMPATVSAKEQRIVTVTLERSRKFLLVEQALAAIDKELGKPTLGDNADTLKEVLFIDQAVFVRVKDKSGGLEVEALLYDLRTKRLLNRVVEIAPANDSAEKKLAGVTTALYKNVSYEAELEAPKDAPPPKAQTRTPVYKTWWLWTVVGVVVVGAVLGGVLAPKPKVCGEGNLCPEVQVGALRVGVSF